MRNERRIADFVAVTVAVAIGVGVVVGVGGASEGDVILRQLRSDDPKVVISGVFAAQRLRERERQAGRVVPTGDNARLVTELRKLLATAWNPEVKRIIAGTMMLAPVPGPQPELLECARSEGMDIARRCLSALYEAHDVVNLGPLVDMLADPTIPTHRNENVDERTAVVSERTSTVIYAISRFGDDAIPLLAPLVKDGTPVARELALWALYHRESAAAAVAAMPALSDPNHWIRFLAVDVIRLYAEHREVLRPLLNDSWLSIRQEVQNTFGLPIEPTPSPVGPIPLAPHDPSVR